MPDVNEIVNAVASAGSWNARVATIRRIPELFGTAEHAQIYAEVARRVYVPRLTPDFAYVHWRDEYELAPLEATYQLAHEGTNGFRDVGLEHLEVFLTGHPRTLRIFRLLTGLLIAEFAEASALLATELDLPPLSKSAVKNAEDAGRLQPKAAKLAAAVIDAVISGRLFPLERAAGTVRSKLEKPDTANGWDSVRQYAAQGVPLPVFLHQRHYGGAFRQLLDATSTKRGDLLEDPVRELFDASNIPYLRTGSDNQDAVATRFGLTVRPAPDFVIFDPATDTLRAILECKGANDGGTARDKAARFRSLRTESQRLGGVPLFAVLGGIGWRRTTDA